ncbi:tetratricopeptide repeat protein [Engelhardtia mirabilis]|uniref:Tetratricopeptide repeat protein n=1 Tax=Engelhardtia mirabilis TaxID=2528011 RepID=A0A518BSS8_9BACT|nr:hypothetical protein Pla133_51420 [Planctomycetes bacterium Pla133]QDV04344.1 hypothetical protein Pla86_51390 [Planctomycetes bacterium Pla86]
MKLALAALALAGLTLPAAFHGLSLAAPAVVRADAEAEAEDEAESAPDEAPLEHAGSDGEPLYVWLEQVGAETQVTVRGRNVSLETVLKEIARRDQRIVEGLSATRRGVLVSIELEERPIEEVLEYVLGGAGLVAELSPGLLIVREDDSSQLTVERLRERAMALYLRATTRYPGHASTERGRLSQGEIEEDRGNPTAALEQYQTLLETFSGSPYRPEAYLRSGLVLEELERWAEAAQQFRQASGDTEFTPEYIPARIGLARCQMEMGNPDMALLMIESLDDAVPPRSRQDQAERGLVRARCQLQREMFVECLGIVDQLERAGLSDADSAEAMRLRAQAFEGLHYYPEAGRAWLVHARMTDGAIRDVSFERAAAIAMDDGDHIGVLFVAAECEKAGSGALLGPMARSARRALGLPIDLGVDDATDSERIKICEEWLEEGELTFAKPVLADLHARRATVHPSLRQRAALAWGRCLYLEAGVEAALSVLRDARPNIEEPAERLALDLMAAEMLEAERQFARAVEAYEGRY